MIKKILLVFLIVALASCESDADRQKREAKESNNELN